MSHCIIISYFLMDFKDGTKVFNIADFPEQSGYLINNNVTDINISYQINGIKPVLDFLTRGAPLIPDVIFTNIGSRKSKYPVAEIVKFRRMGSSPESIKIGSRVMK